MAIAEYFRDFGLNTILVLDDLSTHAKFYRELSLLAKRFPGRDSYPGDIFYTHSRLLERGGYFKHPKAGQVAITCFPVIEIVEGDFTGYIATNVMGITDGHIYLDSNIYFQGMRPAVNVPLSVTRVGRQTLDKLSREMNKNLTTFLASYTKLQTISHFGQELTEDVKRQLTQGELINKFFNQPYQLTVPRPVQLIIISMIQQNLITTKEELEKLKKGIIAASYDRRYQKTLFDITDAKDVKELNENVMKNKDILLKLKIEEKSKVGPAGPQTEGSIANHSAQPNPIQNQTPPPQNTKVNPQPSQPTNQGPT
jgi:F-type H+-transporting ATPase subunit alpha